MKKENIISLLYELEEYFDGRSDADCDQDGYIPNKEMQHLIAIREALWLLEAK